MPTIMRWSGKDMTFSPGFGSLLTAIVAVWFADPFSLNTTQTALLGFNSLLIMPISLGLLALGTLPNRANRKKRLEKMHAAVVEFSSVLDDIQEFAYDFFQVDGRRNEVASSASKIKADIYKLESLLASKKIFMQTCGGRPQNERALKLARYVKLAFEENNLKVVSNQAGAYYKALVTCLDALQTILPNEHLPCEDPSRIVKSTLKDNTHQI